MELAGSQIGQIGSRHESLAASQEEAGNRDAFGNLIEVNTNVMLQCLLKIRLSRVLCAFPTEMGAARSPCSADAVEHLVPSHAILACLILHVLSIQ